MTQPGGRIVMGSWIPNDPTLLPQLLRADDERLRGRHGSRPRRLAAGELEAPFNDHNTSTDDETTSIPATFLRVTVAV